MHFEIYRHKSAQLADLVDPKPSASFLDDAHAEWRWRLRGDNREIIAGGEGYKTRADCQHAVALVQSTSMLTLVEIAGD